MIILDGIFIGLFICKKSCKIQNKIIYYIKSKPKSETEDII